MSRTYRSNPRARNVYSYGVVALIYIPWSTYSLDIERKGSLTKGGWKEAKRLLSKEEYGRLRTLRGDKFTHYLGNDGVPHWYRNTIERKHRGHTKRELHRYLRTSEYEAMVNKEPGGAEFYYWF